MIDCPNYEAEIVVAVKCLTVAPAKHTAREDILEIQVGIFKCPKCKSKFRSRVSSTTYSGKTKNIKNIVEKVKEVRSINANLEASAGKDKYAENGAGEFICGNRTAHKSC